MIIEENLHKFFQKYVLFLNNLLLNYINFCNFAFKTISDQILSIWQKYPGDRALRSTHFLPCL